MVSLNMVNNKHLSINKLKKIKPIKSKIAAKLTGLYLVVDW